MDAATRFEGQLHNESKIDKNKYENPYMQPKNKIKNAYEHVTISNISKRNTWSTLFALLVEEHIDHNMKSLLGKKKVDIENRS